MLHRKVNPALVTEVTSKPPNPWQLTRNIIWNAWAFHSPAAILLLINLLSFPLYTFLDLNPSWHDFQISSSRLSVFLSQQNTLITSKSFKTTTSLILSNAAFYILYRSCKIFFSSAYYSRLDFLGWAGRGWATQTVGPWYYHISRALLGTMREPTVMRLFPKTEIFLKIL